MHVASSPFGNKRGEVRERRNNSGLIYLLFFLLVLLPCKACPDGCECLSQTVKCQNKDLRAIPQPIPANTQFLFITGNNISFISMESFPTPLEQLTYLNLTGNELVSVESKAFHNLPKLTVLDMSNNRIWDFSGDAFPYDSPIQNLTLSGAFQNFTASDEVLGTLKNGTLLQLTHLDLSNNDLMVLPDGAFRNLSKLASVSLRNNSIIFLQNGALKGLQQCDLDLRDNSLRELPNSTLEEIGSKPGLEVRLQGNPWRCDCFMQDFVAWLKSSGKVSDKHNLTCFDPEDLRGLPLLQVDQSQLECIYSRDMKGVLETSYVLLGMVLALIGVIFLLVLYLNRKGIKRWMHNIRDACRDHMEGYHYRYEINTDPRLANLSINSDV